MRLLALDFGERRIGVAVTDPTLTIASPLTTLTRRFGRRPPWADIEQIVREREVAEIVVGLPFSLDGSESEWTLKVREFARKLGERTGLPVHLIDERLTSVQAEEVVRQSGLSKSKREEKGRIDSTAAALILRSYLDQLERDA